MDNTKTRNCSGFQTLQYFNSSQNTKINESEKLKLEDIKNIYNFLYEDNFSNILIQSKDSFINDYIELNIKEVIKYHFDNIYINTSFFQQTISRYRKEIETKYLNAYSLLNEQYQINKNNLKEKERKYLTHYLKHCINTCEYAYHHCPNNRKGKFILVEENNKIKYKNSDIKYVICLDCKKCYPSTCINMICTPCNCDYLSSVLKENEDKNIVLATWEKYHCGSTFQDQIMKCIKCKKELYLNLLTNKLICKNKNCNFESKPNSIIWKCTFCSKDFRSKVKVYNPLEFQNMKKALNNALTMKIKANSKILPCCKKDTTNLTFYHKEECKGILYKGFLNGKEILVCKNCHAMNFIDKFNWICPLCAKKFHLHHTSSVTPFKAKFFMTKENFTNKNSSNKKPTRIILKKNDSSSSFNNELNKGKNESEIKNEDKFKLNRLNKTNDDKISPKFYSQNVSSYNNIRSINYIKDYNYNNSEIKDKEKKELKNVIKITKEKEKRNIYDFRYDPKKKDKYIKFNSDEITPKHKKKKKKTLYEVLEKRKKQSLGSIRNISLKNNTIESIFVDKNCNKTKNYDSEKLKNNNDDNIHNIQLSKTSLLPNSNSYNKNNNDRDKKRYATTDTELLYNMLNDNDDNNNYKGNNYRKFISNQNSRENLNISNKNQKNYINLTDDLQKKLIKCRSYNVFNKGKKEKNENNNNNKDNKINNQTNYLYTNNSNYNIKVSLNISHNIYPFPKREENYQNEKEDNENNYKKIFNNTSLNKIKEIYIEEILKNTGIKLEKEKKDNNNIMNNNYNNNKNIISNNNYNNYNNYNNKRHFINNTSPINKYNSEYNNKNNIKKEYGVKELNQKGKKGFYYRTTNILFKNSFLNSTKSKDSKNIKNDFNFNSENKKNEPKKLIINNLFNSENKNTSSSPKMKNSQNKDIKRYNISYLNFKSNEKNNNDINNKNLKNEEEYPKEEEDTYFDKSKITNFKDTEKNDSIINSIKKYSIKDTFKLDLMRNVIVSQDKIAQFSKDSIIPIFNDKDFRYIRPIGEGAYGLIYLVENIHNRKQFALKKILCKDLYDIIKHKNQLELIYSMNHKNLMEIYNLQYKYLDNTTYAIYVLMERAQNDWSIDIRKRIINKRPYKEEEIINILKQVVSALAYLQKKGIAHRDIKPQNILLFIGNIFKVADLGEAKNVNDENKHMTLRGSELYMSPILYERHKFKRKDVFHNAYKSDVFSLGFSTLYAMQLNLKIIENIREITNMKLIINSINKDMTKKKYSEKLMNIIFKMIEIDENKRYDFIELEKELNKNF